MPKKKRLFMIAAIAAAAVIAYWYGLWAGGLCVALLVVLLFLLQGLRLAMAHAGVARLATACKHRHFDAMVEQLKTRGNGEEPFSFVVLGDSRGARKVPVMLHEKAKEENPAFVVNTGDLVRFGTAREFEKRYIPLMDIMAPAPVFSVPGNHDRGARNDFAAYIAVHGADRFSFDYGPCRFVGINNSGRRVKAEDVFFLKSELEKSPIQYKFVFIHIPPRYFEDDVVIVDKRRGFKRLQEEFRALLTQAGVTEVFMGHIHGYATKVVDGVRYTLTAGAGAPLGRRLPPEGRVHHYVVLHVGPDGLRREVVRHINGEFVRGE